MPSFPVSDTPGVSTFYDFQSRLWMSDKDNLSDPVHPPKEKPDKKGEKAPPVEKVTVKVLEQFKLHPPIDMSPCERLYDFFKELFLDRSVQDGLVDLRSLSLAGDGTPPSTLLPGNGRSVPATASTTASGTAAVTVPTTGPTATLDGIPTGNAGISAMAYICSLPRIRKATSLYSLFWGPLPGTIPSASFIAGSP